MLEVHYTSRIINEIMQMRNFILNSLLLILLSLSIHQELRASFIPVPNDYVVITHSCGSNNGKIEILDFNLPLHNRYYWEDTGLPGSRINLAPGNYTLNIVQTNGCIESFIYTVLSAEDDCRVDFEITNLGGCCLFRLTVIVYLGTTKLDPGSYSVSWADAPHITSPYRTYSTQQIHNFTATVTLNGNCCTAVNSVTTQARPCTTADLVPENFSELPDPVFKSINFKKRLNEVYFDIDYFTIMITGNAYSCSELADIRNAILVISGRRADGFHRLRHNTLLVRVKDHPVFRGLKQGTTLNIANKGGVQKGSAVIKESEFSYTFNLLDSAYFDIAEIDSDTFRVNGHPWLTGIPSIGNDTELYVKLNNSSYNYDRTINDSQDDYFEDRDENGELVRLIKYHYPLNGYSTAIMPRQLTRVTNFLLYLTSEEIEQYKAFLRYCACFEEIEPLILSSVQDLSLPEDGENRLRIYPNPTNTAFVYLDIFNAKEGELELRLMNINGVETLANKWSGPRGASNRIVYLDNIAAGVYIAQLKYPDGSTLLQKVILF